MSIRFKSVLTMVLGALLGTIFLWNFNIFYVLRDWSIYFDGLVTFIFIVITLVIISSIIMWRVFKPIAQAELLFKEGQSLSKEEDKAVSRAMQRMPLIISLIGVVGFLIGPIMKRVAAAAMEGTPVISFGLLTSIVYSVAIGVYTSFLEIRLIEGYFYQIQQNRKRTSIEQTKQRSWKNRQLLMGFNIMFLSIALFFSSGIGYLEEELLAPGEIDAVSAASENTDYRVDLWTRALQGENLELDQHHPAIAGRLAEYCLKMFILAVIVLALSLLAIRIESKPTENRFNKLNNRLQEIASGNARKDRKLVIIRGDEIGKTIHWINQFIDHQAETISTLTHSIDNLDSISGELSDLQQTLDTLGGGIEDSISSVQSSLQIQTDAVNLVRQQSHSLQEMIVRTNKNLQNQKNTMSSNSAAVEEMAANIGSVSRNAKNAYGETKELVQKSENSSNEMQLLLKDIQNISSTAEDVNKSIGQIAGLAAQTNLLAMNAAIEAAHAGDVGAGFAVVAAEVRKLAEDSSKTAKKITGLIHEMNELSTRGVEQATSARDSFGQINNAVSHNMSIIAEISRAMEEQEVGSRDMQSAMEQLEAITEEAASISIEEEKQSQIVNDSVIDLDKAVESIESQMINNSNQVKELSSFLKSLDEIVKRNTSLVASLKQISGKQSE